MTCIHVHEHKVSLRTGGGSRESLWRALVSLPFLAWPLSTELGLPVRLFSKTFSPSLFLGFIRKTGFKMYVHKILQRSLCVYKNDEIKKAVDAEEFLFGLWEKCFGLTVIFNMAGFRIMQKRHVSEHC